MNECDGATRASETCSVQVGSRRDGREVVIRLSGEFDLECELDVELILEVASSAETVELHMSDVEFADSTLLGLLLRMADRFDLRLVGPLRPQLDRLMRLTGVLERFRVRGLEGERPA